MLTCYIANIIAKSTVSTVGSNWFSFALAPTPQSWSAKTSRRTLKLVERTAVCTVSGETSWNTKSHEEPTMKYQGRTGGHAPLTRHPYLRPMFLFLRDARSNTPQRGNVNLLGRQYINIQYGFFTERQVELKQKKPTLLC